MAYNIVYYDSGTNTIQQFSSTDLDELAERVLRVMAAGTYTGTITIGTSNPIGTFTDTYYNQAVGTNQDTGITTGSTVYTLSQVMTATLGAASDPPMYVGLDTSVSGQTILQENLTTREQLADEILSRMVAGTGGTNSYYLGTSAPADGATWVSLGSLLDTKTAGTITITDYKLWERTTSGATLTSKNPMKITSDPLQSFSDAEVEAIIKTIEQRIIATGIGTYELATSAPGTGTWTNAGTITDNIETLDSTTYLGPQTFQGGPYTLSYLGANSFFDLFAGFDGPVYETSYNFAYFKSYQAIYYGAPVNAIDYQGGPLGPPEGYLGAPVNAIAYVGPGGTYSGPQNYIANYLGPTEYGKQYQSPYTANYFATPGYTVTYASIQLYTGGPLDAVAFDSASSFVAPSYTNENALSYTQVLIGSGTSSVGTKTLWRRIA
jgi:hypothetical protein